MAKTPQAAAEKWANRLKGATGEVRAGVESVTESPMDKAADAADKWINRVQEAHSSGKFAARLRATPLAKWKQNTLEKGIGRIAAGVDNARGDVQSFYDQLFPFQDSLKATVESMPDVTLEDSIARMTTWVRGMADFQRS